MGVAAVEPRRPEKITEAAARSGFRGYGPGSRRRAGKADVKKDKVLGQLIDAWEMAKLRYIANDTFTYAVPRSFHRLWKGYETVMDPDTTYKEMLNLIEGLKYTPDDVASFGVILAEYQDDKEFPGKAGLFLSALINNGSDSDYTIHITHGVTKYLGYRNRKNIVVKGAAGDCVGEKMEGGEIRIEGGFDSLGQIRGGKIYHKGVLIVDK